MIKLDKLTKRFNGNCAVCGLNLEVPKGEIFGLLGPNGAGKTTTIRMLTTLASITEGRAEINGFDVRGNPLSVKRLIGLAPQGLNLEIELTALENLIFHGRLHKMPSRQRLERAEELLKFTELWHRRNDHVSTFSGGMKRRLLVARAIMHRPSVLFLDEPTVGLDPQIRRRMWDMILGFKSEGITLFITTHYIEEAEFLCDRVGIMNRGNMVALDSPSALKEATGLYAVICGHNASGCADSGFFASREEAVQYASTLNTDVIIRKTNLEDVFIHLTGEAIHD